MIGGGLAWLLVKKKNQITSRVTSHNIEYLHVMMNTNNVAHLIDIPQ